MQSAIIQKILKNIHDHPDRAAIWVNQIYYTYRELYERALIVTQILFDNSIHNNFCVIYSDKTIHAFQSILGALFAGKAYVPLNPHFPVDRNIKMMAEFSCDVICIDVNQQLAEEFLLKLSAKKVCVFRQDLYEYLVQTVPQHEYVLCENAPRLFDYSEISVNSNDYAYLMFTSGSTGQPKGIAITHGNLSQYVSSICELYQINSQDRFSLLSELTFDLSVHEMLICWYAAATLYVIPDSYILGLKKFIQQHQITCWTSVPANITLLQQLKQLTSDCFPSIRLTFFCGEVLLQTQALQWSNAASQSQIVNLYGPTEATVTFTYFNWRSDGDYNDSVPIGVPLPNQACCLIDEKNNVIKDGKIGELCLSGNQVINSYWNNLKKSQQTFQKFSWDTENKLWYRTGDLAQWHDEFGYIYHGRIDDQWQIRGYRVEKLEIENELRKIANNNAIAIVPIATNEMQIDGFVAFVNEEIDAVHLAKNARQNLPSHMVPRKIISVTALPYNMNGKVDYIALKKKFNEMELALPCEKSL